MGSKKGQVSIFLILALIVLMTGMFTVLLFPSQPAKGNDDIKEKVSKYMTECISLRSEEALQLFGLQGGELRADGQAALLIIPFLVEGKPQVPQASILEKEFSSYLEGVIPSCADQLDISGYSKEIGQPKVTTVFGRNETIISVDYKVGLRRDSSFVEVSSSSVAIPVRMSHILDVSQEVVESVAEHPGTIDYSLFSRFGSERFFLLPYDETTFLLTVMDSNSRINNKPYLFTFALVFEPSPESAAISRLRAVYPSLR